MPQFVILLLVTFLMIWLLVVLPQRRRQAQHRQMLEAIEPGVEVLTAGGVFGTVNRVDGDELRVTIAEGVEVRVAARAVAAVLPREDEGEGSDVPSSAPDEHDAERP